MTTTWTAVEERIAWTATEDPSYQFVTLRPTTVTLESGGGGGGAVDSVNGQTGVVVLDAGDVGALDASSGYNTANGWLKLDGSGTAPDSTIPASIARDSEVSSAISTHAGATDPHGDRAYATSAVGTHTAASDPHGDRAYTDAQIGAMLSTAFDWKASVKCASTSNLALSGTSNVDGVTVPAGTRVLAKNQSDATQNGIWVTASGAWTRATDADADAEVTGGMAVPVVSGSTNGGRAFMLVTADPITVGATALTFQRIDAGTLVAANNLSDLTSASTALTNLGISAFVQTLLDDADAATARVTLGVVIGTDVAAQNDARFTDARNPTTLSAPGWFAGQLVLDSNAVVGANTAAFCRIVIPRPVVVNRLWCNINTSSGNIDLGLYADDGTGASPGAKLVSTGSTASPGTGNRSFSVADTTIPAGVVWVAVSADNGTLQLARSTFGVVASATGSCTKASSFPLPSSISSPSASTANTFAVWITKV